MILNPYLIPYTKIYLKYIKDLNIIPKTVKLLEGNTEENFLILVWAMIFLDMTPKAQATKEKIDKWNLHQTTKLMYSK